MKKLLSLLGLNVLIIGAIIPVSNFVDSENVTIPQQHNFDSLQTYMGDNKINDSDEIKPNIKIRGDVYDSEGTKLSNESYDDVYSFEEIKPSNEIHINVYNFEEVKSNSEIRGNVYDSEGKKLSFD